jgi:hypothetical protein
MFVGGVIESLGNRCGNDRSHGIPFAAAMDVQRTKTFEPLIIRSAIAELK